MKHFYLNCSLETLAMFKDQNDFQKTCEYESDIDRCNVVPYEFGRIKTKDAYYHIISGRIPQHGCPWCGEKEHEVKVSGEAYCIKCKKCGACGPHSKFSKEMVQNATMFNTCMTLLSEQYKSRRSWDDDFKNPYQLTE